MTRIDTLLKDIQKQGDALLRTSQALYDQQMQMRQDDTRDAAGCGPQRGRNRALGQPGGAGCCQWRRHRQKRDCAHREPVCRGGADQRSGEYTG
ncbi:hypothetical protein [Pseudomonas juntendi]|nr:hypothetical protein [Pseudomonas sp. NY5710]